MSATIVKPTLFSRLEPHDRILIAGAGGGFDVYAGLPLFVALRAMSKQVLLANLTFTPLRDTNVDYLAPHLGVVTNETAGSEGYFPERRLAEWLVEHRLPSTVYVFGRAPAPYGLCALGSGAAAWSNRVD
jgi:hypothetical protein